MLYTQNMGFRKDWKLERVINQDAPIFGVMHLRRTSPRTFIWQECVQTPLKGQGMIEGVQNYHIERQGHILSFYRDAGGKKSVLFQTFNLKQPDTTSIHLCGQDRYESAFQICTPSDIRIKHTVAGPRKDYIMQTHYFRS